MKKLLGWEEPFKIIHSELGRRRDHIDQTCLQRKQTDRGRGGKQGKRQRRELPWSGAQLTETKIPGLLIP